MSRRWWALVAVGLATFMTYLDNNVVNVAIPTIQRDLHLSIAGLEWVVSSYVLVFAGLLLVGGRTSAGRVQPAAWLFVIGLSVFPLLVLAGRRAGLWQRQRADRRAAAAGPGRRPHGADHAGHHRGHLHRPP